MFRCKNSLTAEPHHSHHISGATGGIGSVQYIDKTMQVGPDLSIVEPPHICRDGDSVQVGSILINFSLTVKAETLIFIFVRDSAISSAKQGKSGSIYNLVKS